jgi:chemotaxis protein methyltransferase CheR
MLTENVEELEMDLLLTAIVRRYGYDYRNYAPASLRRRVKRVLDAEGLPTISALQERVLREPACMERFISTLSVHVTAMFRDPEFFLALRTEVVPILKTHPFVRIWCAGCSTGEEVYALAILLQEEGLYDRCRIYATDISDSLLRRAEAGVFPLSAMREHTANYQKAGGSGEFSRYYVTDSDRAVFRSSLRRNLVFSQHNLVSDGPFNEFQLILCRNVTIYFDSLLTERVYHLLTDSLVRFGVLGLGRKETLAHTTLVNHFRPLAGDLRIYRKER